CSPVFVQRAGVAAIVHGEETVARTQARFHAARDDLVGALAKLPGVEVSPPAGAMYAFFRIAGLTDALAFCTWLVLDVGVGRAPGSAFGPAGEGFVRWC